MRKLGLDVGFGWTKVVTEEGHFKFRTLVAPYPEVGESDVKPVVLLGKSYVVGEDARFLPDVRTISNISSYLDYLPVLTRAAIVRAKMEGEKVGAVVGLPPVYKAYRDKTAEALRSIGVEAFVVPQGYGILKDVEEQVEDNVLIIDVGFNTVDYLVARRGEEGWVKVRSGTVENLGVQRAVTIFSERVAREYPFVQREPLGKKALYFEKARIVTEGGTLDLTQEKKAAIEEFVSGILSRLDEELKLREIANQVEAIVLAGGGAHFVPKELFSHPNIIVPEEPEFSQARGYYRVALSVFGEEEEG